MPENTEKKMYIEAPIVVRTYDIDFMQIAHNSVYLKWFEDLRLEILNRFFPLQQMISDHCSPILSETHIKYLTPVTLTSKPIGKAWVSLLNKGRWNVNVVIEEDGIKYAEGNQCGYYLNLATKRLTRFPQTLIDKFSNWTFEL